MQNYLIHWFPFCSGGLCDRILGLSSSFCIAEKLNMKLLVKWDHCDLSSGFIINPEYNYYDNQVSFNFINLTNHDSIVYFQTINIRDEWKDQNIMIWSNINIYNYLLKNPYFVDLQREDYLQLFSKYVKLILGTVFIINPQVMKNLESIERYDIGIHIRTGDKQIYNKENEEYYRPYITRVFQNILEHGVSKDKKIFISSDCLLAFEIAKDCFTSFKHHKGPIIHTAEEDKIYEDGLHKVLLDLLSLCKCGDTLFIGWNSNFSRIASLYNFNRKFICYEYENNIDIIKQCSPEVLFSYYSNGKYT